MMLGFLEGGLSSSRWAGGRHLHGWEVGTPFLFSATGRQGKEKRETCPVKTPKGGLPRSIRVSQCCRG